MDTTSLSLLGQAQNREPGGWERFQSVYEPLLRFWVLREPAARNDVEDLMQDLLLKLHIELPHFKRQRLGSFRRWLRVLATNQVREHLRKRRPELSDRTVFDQLAEPDNSLITEWDREYDRHVAARLIQLVRQEVDELSWKLFAQTELEELSPAEVARLSGVEITKVYRTRHSIMRRLRELGQEILEKDS